MNSSIAFNPDGSIDSPRGSEQLCDVRWNTLITTVLGWYRNGNQAINLLFATVLNGKSTNLSHMLAFAQSLLDQLHGDCYYARLLELDETRRMNFHLLSVLVMADDSGSIGSAVEQELR